MLCRLIPLAVLLLFTGCSPEGKEHETADSEGKQHETADSEGKEHEAADSEGKLHEAADSEGKEGAVEVGLATVVGQTITAVDVDRYERSLPPNLHSKKEGVAAYREYLQSLVDKELVLYEAKKRGLDQLPGLEQMLTKMVNKRIAGELSDEMVSAGVSVTEEELRAFYEEHSLGWEIWPAHILSASEEDAREIIRLLDAGSGFSKLASERSLAGDAEKGGNLGGYFDESGAVTGLRDGVFHLEEGQVSEPIETIDGYEVVKVLKKRRISFKPMRPMILERVIWRKGNERYKAVIDSLKEAYGLRYHRDRIHAVLDGVHRRGLDQALALEPLIEHKGGAIKILDAVQALINVEKGALPPDSLLAFRALEIVVVSDSLLTFEARAQGRDQRSDIVAWKDKKRQGLIASQLRVDVVADRGKSTDTEVKAYYERYIDTYRSLPGIIEMTEVLCETRAEAEGILARAQAGERLEELAVRHSIRSTMKPVGGHTFADSGRISIESLIQSPYRTHFGDSNNKDVGVLQGPMEVQDKYSVFRLDQPYEKLLMSLDNKLQQQIRTDIRQQRQGALFNALLDSLHEVYAGQVQIDEEAVSRHAATR